MAVYTDIFIATEAMVASAPLDRASPAEWFPTIGAKYIASLELSTLETLLAREGAYAQLEARMDALEQAVVREWENIWVYRLPDALATALTQLAPADIPQMAENWLKTEELRRADLDWATQYIGDLRDLAIRAQAEGKRMYLWVAV